MITFVAAILGKLSKNVLTALIPSELGKDLPSKDTRYKLSSIFPISYFVGWFFIYIYIKL